MIVIMIMIAWYMDDDDCHHDDDRTQMMMMIVSYTNDDCHCDENVVRHCTFPLLSDNTKSALPQTSESPDLIRVPLINNSDPTCCQSHHIIPISFDAEKSEALGS